ncbi:PH domain-containing protein [Svornostia abyssi]|uniref:PH domain-containing protein n=1 Tax=Svornostia abyssi TaxID=2898438 RepID=A0ABY5PBN0_9ACTN|nr:PH domain-containing protein [Parviterribacteraceae bacterium J379]
MELHEGETVLFEGHPSWRSALLFFAKGIGLGVLIGAILFFAIGTAAGIAALAVIAAITIIASLVVRQATKYVITDERLHIRRGIVSRSIHETRLSRVQDVAIEQGVFERILRIGRADFDTAADKDDQFVFEGIANPDEVRAAVDKAHRLAEHKTPPGEGTVGL